MDLYHAIRDLRQERDKLTQVIAALEEFQRTGTLPERRKRGRKSMGDAERKAVSDRLKKYWADRHAREAAGAEVLMTPLAPWPG